MLTPTYPPASEPELCDCAGSDWSPEGEWCSGAEDTFAAVERVLAARVREFVSGIQAWCAINEIAEPPLDWEGLGEFLGRALPPVTTGGADDA